MSEKESCLKRLTMPQGDDSDDDGDDDDFLDERNKEEGFSSSEEDDYKRLIKAAHKSADMASREEQMEQKRSFALGSTRTKSKLRDREDVNENRQAVEMFTNSSGVVNQDFIVPKRAHLTTAQFDLLATFLQN